MGKNEHLDETEIKEWRTRRGGAQGFHEFLSPKEDTVEACLVRIVRHG